MSRSHSTQLRIGPSVHGRRFPGHLLDVGGAQVVGLPAMLTTTPVDVKLTVGKTAA
jgi:hypothetical protein